MGIVVQKYGGSSLSDASAVKRVARRIVEVKKSGHDVVVAVSAMGDTTDELLELAEGVSPLPPARELDMLLTAGERISMALVAMAISDLGFTARSFTGSQAGVITDSVHGKAKIIDVTPGRISAAIDEGHIVIVAGFQGVSQDTKEITTLGRGGTDTTAVALAAALHADVCEIYTDVDGVFTADPRIVPSARKLDTVTYEEMLELAAVRCEDPAPPVRGVRPPLRHPDPRAVLVQPAGRHAGRRQHQRRGPSGGHHGSSHHRRSRPRPERGEDHRGRRTRQGRRGRAHLRRARQGADQPRHDRPERVGRRDQPDRHLLHAPAHRRRDRDGRARRAQGGRSASTRCSTTTRSARSR